MVDGFKVKESIESGSEPEEEAERHQDATTGYPRRLPLPNSSKLPKRA